MPKSLGKPHVPEPCDDALIDERLADKPVRVGCSQTSHHRLHFRRLGEEIRAQALRRTLVEREHRAVPLRGLPLPASQHQPRKAMPASSAACDAPAAAHAEVAAKHDRAVEPQEEVLADRLDVVEHPPVDDTCDARREPAWVWALG